MTAKKSKKLGFEEGVQEIERITAAMDSGEMSLDEAITAYERGLTIIRTLEADLASYQKRIEQIDPETGEIHDFEELHHEL